MVFFTTYVNYTTRVNMSISIVSMTGGKEKSEPECVRIEREQSGTTEMGFGNITTTKAPLANVSHFILLIK